MSRDNACNSAESKEGQTLRPTLVQIRHQASRLVRLLDSSTAHFRQFLKILPDSRQEHSPRTAFPGKEPG